MSIKVHLISFVYVKMTIETTSYLKKTQAMAVSRPYAPTPGRGTDMLHGACVIFPKT